MRRRRAIKWLIGLLGIGIAWGMIRLLWPHERLLLSRSSLVAHESQFDTYNWQSPHSILLFRKLHDSDNPWSSSLEKIDLLTARHLSYPTLAKQLAPNNTSASNFDTSPDGKWLLWSTMGTRSERWKWGPATGWLANLETGHLEHFPIRSMSAVDTTEPNKLYWMADSAQFAEIDFGRHWSDVAINGPLGEPTMIRSVNAPQKAKALKLRADWKLQSYACIHLFSEEHLVAITVPFYNRAEDYAGLPEIVQTSLKSNASPQQHWPLTLPAGMQILSEVAFSPHGDRIAISVEGDPHSAWLDVLRRWHIPVRIPSHPQVGIWIVSLNGKQCQEVGHMTPERDWWRPYEMPDHLRWSPDGKQLGFVYKRDLYRVSTD